MNHTRNGTHVGPILANIRELDPKQRLTMLKILYWVLFCYLQFFVFAAIAADLLIATAAIAAAVVALRKTEVGQRPNLLIVNGAIVASLFWSGVHLTKCPGNSRRRWSPRGARCS